MSDLFCAALAYRSSKGTFSASEQAEFLERMEAYSADRLAALERGEIKIDRELRREIADYMEIACSDACVVPPPSLLALMFRALGPGTRRREGTRNAQRLRRAVMFVARHPANAPPSKTAIREHLGFSNQQAVERLLKDPQFDRMVKALQRL